MQKIKSLCSILLCLVSFPVLSQSVEFKGQVIANSDLEGIHVLNISSKFYTITSDTGSFKIKGKLNDTLIFSSVQYKLTSLKLSEEIIGSKVIRIKLEEFVNQLDEVYVGSPLSGNLQDDIENVKGEPDINFYDVGIPGYKGKPKTKRERELYEADHGKYFVFYGVGFVINVNKILNTISGRTKILKNRVDLEQRDELMSKLIAKFSKELFQDKNVSQSKQMEFFYFCSEQENFLELENSNSDLIVYHYLENKLKTYMSNQSKFD